MRRLGVLGGTFDPIHIGHVLLAQFVRERLELDLVLFVPAADPPHKEERRDLAAAADRWAMVELAIEGLPGCRGSRLELDRPGKSYTVDTLQELRRLHPESELYLIIGTDNAPQLPTWYDLQGILALCTVVAGSRLTEGAPDLGPLASRLRRVETPVIQVSSTEVRRRVESGLPIRYLVPDKVEAYIRQRGLYQGPAGAGPALDDYQAIR
jgi:nicotinate-nucleotide adenylyltransferase